MSNCNWHRLLAVAAMVVALSAWQAGRAVADQTTPAKIQIAKDGAAILPVVAGSLKEPVDELRHYLRRIVGNEFPQAQGRQKQGAIYVGLAADFPWIEASLKPYRAESLGPDGFVRLASEEQNAVYLVAYHRLGVQHAVTAALHELGCRWFFPGETWEVVPTNRGDVFLSGNDAQQPSFPTQRRIWYGFGAYGPCKEDWEVWVRHNRMGGPLEVGIGHSWAGLNPDKEFDAHPEWFALVDGQRQPTKPCYSHPEVIARAKQSALRRAEQGTPMISITPPDGLGYCECEACLTAAGVKDVFEDKGCLFGKRSDGEIVNVTSETVFGLANEVAKAVAAKHPKTLIGCYAYSAYAHPPSFRMHPNVYLQTTTAYRRTPLTLEQQVSAFGEKTNQLGIREYYSVYQWDWDYPDPGKMTPDILQQDLTQFHGWGVTAVNAEASNNWAARGLGYYVAARLLWDVETNTDEIVRDFYVHAFGPAARPMERYYTRWYGASVAVFADQNDLPQRVKYFDKGQHNIDALREAYRDLDEALRLAAGDEAIVARINDLRMYAHYLLLRYQLEQAAASNDESKILAAIGNETTYGAKLTYTNMLHTRPLLGKAFLRRFRQHAAILEVHPPAQQKTGQWRKPADPPTQEELDKLWQADKSLLKL